MKNIIKSPTYTGAGVYCIENTRTHKKYIGSTLKYKNRICTHNALLKSGRHNSPDMQKDFDAGDRFITYLLYKTDLKKDQAEKDIREKEYFEAIKAKETGKIYNKQIFVPYSLTIRENKEKEKLLLSDLLGGIIADDSILKYAEHSGHDFERHKKKFGKKKSIKYLNFFLKVLDCDLVLRNKKTGELYI